MTLMIPIAKKIELPPKKKRNIFHPSPVRGKGKFKMSWKLPPYVAQSTRGDKYAYGHLFQLVPFLRLSVVTLTK